MKFWAIDSPVMRVLGRLGGYYYTEHDLCSRMYSGDHHRNFLKCSVCGGDEDGKRGRSVGVEGILESL